MRYYEITLPTRDNAGQSYGPALESFERICLTVCGGFTAIAQKGAWLNDRGFRFDDASVAYRFTGNEGTRAWLLTRAFALFSDQEAIFTAEIGKANVIPRS